MSDFTFNEKTGELARGGIIMVLHLRHADIFSVVLAAPQGDRVPSRVIAESLKSTDIMPFEIASKIKKLNLRLAKVGIVVEGKRGEGYRLVVNEMPKWAPTIPPEQPVPN